MRICITNDDGIRGEGLRVLAEWARKLGEVVIYAPAMQQSAKSHSIEIHKPFPVEKVDHETGFRAYQVHSTPADCVRVAMMAMEERFDLVISGINSGYNLGREIIYSGTVGAALEAGIQGARAIAISTNFNAFSGIEPHLDRMWQAFEEDRLFSVADVWNVNIPPRCTGQIAYTAQGGPFYSDTFFLEEGRARVEGKYVCRPGTDPSMDTDAVLTLGMISLTPLSLDFTRRDALAALPAHTQKPE